VPGPTPVTTRTLAFLFCDLRGYTKYTETHGDLAAADLVRSYRAIVRELIDQYGGREISTGGDSLFIVFDSVASAVRFAGAVLTNAGSCDPPIKLGIGVHAGEAADGELGFVAGPVNIASRLCAIAKAGELLVTDAVRSLTRTAVDARFQSVGLRRLKGVEEPAMVWRIEVPGAARSADDDRPPRWLTVAAPAALAVAASSVAYQFYLITADAIQPLLNQRWSTTMPPELNPLLTAVAAIYVVADLVVVTGAVARAAWLPQIGARIMVLMAMLTGLLIPPYVLGLLTHSVRGVGGLFLVIFGVLSIVGFLALAYGLYRRRVWVVGVGFAVCALFAASVDLLPVALVGAWALTMRRENAFY
jgi:class 3 adenylate cyclase